MPEKNKKCEFDNNGECLALVCYSDQKCNSRDKNGNPIYKPIEIPKEPYETINELNGEL